MNYLRSIIVVLSLTAIAHAEKFVLKVVNELGEPLPARIRVRDQTGRDHCPSGSRVIPVGNDKWFVTSGSSELEFPSGKVEVRVEHGLEYQPVKQLVTCEHGQTNRHTVQPKRWINMREQGYLCGENHLHVPLDELAPQLVAEGLDFGTSLQWWNAKLFDTPTVGGYIRNLEFAGVKVPTTVFDYEIEHDWGAVYVIGQPTPLIVENDSAIPNLSLIQKSHKAGSLVCYQGGWSREVLFDALLGVVDVVNVCNNNFLRHAYQPRSKYSNLLDVSGFPTYADNAHDMLRMNCETYYRLLNCGLHLAAGAGSATGAKNTPVGYNRVYVRTAGKDSLQSFIQRWREGRNFATNGPMLLLCIDEQYHPGDTIDFGSKGGIVDTEVVVHSSQPVSEIEVIVNGRVVHTANETELSEKKFRVPIKIEEGAWLAAKCTVEDDLLSDSELATYKWGTDEMPRMPTRLRFAHTSPIYIQVDGHGARVQQSVDEANAMLAAFARFSRENSSAEVLEEIELSLEKARSILGK
ncbi:CehA/McbA family metallohydrolase [Bythopirellula goksoeyrii]|uniref:Uncharacterized protein n=1 Tax=Bythopirellula goksoeyrii TaxID=1400387 RepID=A0A5B9Q6L8_9BACT|nr:CehA/McbA family metallohydrolase [Bythopirellula goksoeyrii]QEG33175.1 hypothetical protein Pr1d_04360 [Bythopirellula goksoeyrii]